MSKAWLKNRTIEASDRIVTDLFKWAILTLIMLVGLAVMVPFSFLRFEDEPRYMNQPQREAGKWKIYPENGYDKQNRYAKFLFVALSDRFSWAKGETNVLILDGKRLNEDEVKKTIFNDLSKLITVSGGLIAIGTSSQEGTRIKEEERALLRSEQLASWLKTGINSNKGLYRLSLGQYIKQSADFKRVKTNYQRPAVIVCILDWDINVDMLQALTNAMLKQRDLPNPENYSTLKFREIQKIQPPPFSFKKSFFRMLENISDKFNIFK